MDTREALISDPTQSNNHEDLFLANYLQSLERLGVHSALEQSPELLQRPRMSASVLLASCPPAFL